MHKMPESGVVLEYVGRPAPWHPRSGTLVIELLLPSLSRSMDGCGRFLGESITKYLVALAASINAYFSFYTLHIFKLLAQLPQALCDRALCPSKQLSEFIGATYG